MIVTINNMDLKQIAESGQCFRWKIKADDTYIIPGIRLEHDKLEDLIISQHGNQFEVSCSEAEWSDYWSSYFDLDTDYEKIKDLIMASGDEHAIEAYLEGSGIRILRQDLWEMIVTFLISQNNNIKRITASVDEICKRNDGLFPRPGEVDSNIFMDRSLGLGYRSPFLKEIFDYTAADSEWLERLKSYDYVEAEEALRERKGIGPKVAACICLFGLHHIEAFPIDTHVKQLLGKYYAKGFDFEYYNGCAGIIQQYLFYYELKHKE